MLRRSSLLAGRLSVQGVTTNHIWGAKMSEFDTWMSGLGVDVGALKAKGAAVLDDAKQQAKKAEDWVEKKAGEAVDAAKEGVDEIKKGAAAVVDGAGKAVDQAKQAAGAVAGAAGKAVTAAKVMALGDQSGKPVPRQMESDCKPTKGYVPGPSGHLLCSTHGHVVDTRSGMIIANSVAEYAAQGLGAAASQLTNDINAAGKSNPKAPTSFPGDTDPPPSGDASASADDALSKQAGAPVKIEDIRASVTIPAGQVLDDSSENVVSTTTDAHINVWINAAGIVADFDPFLSIGSGHWFAKDIKLQQVSFNWRTQQFGASWNTSAVTNLLGNVGDKILAKLESTLRAALPGRFFDQSYDPFNDAELAKDLPGIASKLFPKSSGGGASVKTTDARLTGDISLGGELRRDPISIASGTKVSLSCSLAGGVPSSADDLQVSSLRMGFSGGTANVNFKLLDQEVPAVFVRAATFFNGGKLSLDYDVIDESIVNLIRIVIAEEARREGQLVEGNLTRDGVMRALVEKELKTKIEPLLRKMIIDNKDAIEGIDLPKALGIK